MKDRDARLELTKLLTRIDALERRFTDLEAAIRSARGSFYRKLRAEPDRESDDTPTQPGDVYAIPANGA